MKKGYNIEELPSLEDPRILEPEDWDSLSWSSFCSCFLGDDVDPLTVERIVISKERGLEYFLNEEPRTKSSFETIFELLEENPTTMFIEINSNGIYIDTDDELRRELDLKTPASLKTNSFTIIEKLKEILI